MMAHCWSAISGVAVFLAWWGNLGRLGEDDFLPVEHGGEPCAVPRLDPADGVRTEEPHQLVAGERLAHR